MNIYAACILSLVLLNMHTEAKRHSRMKHTERIQKIPDTAGTALQTALSKQTKNMTFDEAVVAKQHYLKEKDWEMVIKAGQRILAVGGDQETLRKTRLELAEVYLEQQNFKEADKYAQEYQKYYPGAQESRRAQYIAIRANYLSRLTSDRDQEKTHETLKLAQEFLERYSHDTEYKQSIVDIKSHCYQTLVRSELNIITTQLHAFNFSKKKEDLAAAQKRLGLVKDKYLAHVPQAGKKIVEYELLLAQAENKPELIKQKQTELAQLTKSPTNPSTEVGFYQTAKSYFVEDNDQFFA
jgi:outer membrane protein assembly factor BamD (BamD/ComL family)